MRSRIATACGLSAVALALSLGWVFGTATVVRAAEKATSPAEVRLRQDVIYLAHDEQEGREPGTPGIEAAARYIAAAFEHVGLTTAPGASRYFQPFRLSGPPMLGKPLELKLNAPKGAAITGEPIKEFSPLAIGTPGTLRGVDVVFAGYGITARDRNGFEYDDYAKVDVKGKAVLIIRRQPRDGRADSPFSEKTRGPFAFLSHKATNAFQHGAAAILMVNDTGSAQGGKDDLMPFTSAGTEPLSKLPFLMLKREFADKLLAAAGQPSVKELEALIDSDVKPKSRALDDCTLDARVVIHRTDIETRNVIGVLEGSGPLADETVVVGGHYDHLGHGGLLSGSLALLSKDIHNGADDNASGTAMVLELARRLAKRNDPLPRRVVFMAFSGEERGLLGSRYYVEHPLYPLKNTVMMLNCDMVGRLNDKHELTMIGTATTSGMEPIVEALGASAGLTIKKVSGLSDGFGGSDHQSFYSKGVPVLFAFTGIHLDYHRPTDDADRVNYRGMARIADYLELILLDVARRPKRPEYVALSAPAGRGGRSATRGGGGGERPLATSLGTMPDYADTSMQGLKIAGVRPGGPADKGGLQGGDVIVGFGGKPIATIHDYMESLNRYKPGDSVELVIKRDGKEKKVTVTLGAPPAQPKE
jgi:hypothetical protein